jgi:hypothetical protein
VNVQRALQYEPDAVSVSDWVRDVGSVVTVALEDGRGAAED